MNHKKSLLQVFFLAFLLFCLDGCFLFPDSSTKETLPPATQTGANTFGCYVNGKVWLPKGNVGPSNLDSSYDPTFDSGTFDIATYRILSEQNQQYIYIFMTNLNKAGSYKLDNIKVGSATFDYSTQCNYDRDSLVYRNGFLEITKFDLSKGIISGTFEFTLHKQNCDTLKITQGRFDMKM